MVLFIITSEDGVSRVMLREHFDNLFWGVLDKRNGKMLLYLYVPQVPYPVPGNSPSDNIKNVHSINGRYHCFQIVMS